MYKNILYEKYDVFLRKCSPSLARKEMQIKTTLRFHLTPIRITTSRSQTTTNAGKDAREKEPSYAAGGNVN
jgi:hypothetical protein